MAAIAYQFTLEKSKWISLQIIRYKPLENGLNFLAKIDPTDSKFLANIFEDFESKGLSLICVIQE